MTTPRNQQRFTNPQSPAPSNGDGNAELLASASADSGDGNPSTEVSGDDDASPLMQAAVAQESDTAGAFLQQGANDTEDHNAVSTMMDDQNSTDSSLVAFDSQADEEELDMDTGEKPDRRPPGQALAGLLKKLRSKTEDTPPQPEPPPQDTDGDGQFDSHDPDRDGDGIPNESDDQPDGVDGVGLNDSPDSNAATPRQVDLSNIPPSQPSQQLADIGQEGRVSSREMVDPRYRSSAAKNDLSLPRESAPRRMGRGKAARREMLRVNRGTGRSPR